MTQNERGQLVEADSESFRQIVKRKLTKWALVSIDPVMLVIHLTIIYTLYLVADDFLLAQIVRSCGNVGDQSGFVAALLRGVRIFSAVGTATGYALHVTYSLFVQGRGVARKIRESEEGGI